MYDIQGCCNCNIYIIYIYRDAAAIIYLYRDVAARNCWLSSPMSVKLCDSALSRDIFPNDYHCLGDNENRPVSD